MATNKKWTLMVQLSMNQWHTFYSQLEFDESMWDWVLEEAPKRGFNHILLEVGDGIQYHSHPEISTEGAWSHRRVHKELARCREHGLTVIPKLNFSSFHCGWMKQYSRMISSDIYYRVAADLIREVYEVFEHPQYIHLGMDEEDINMAKNREYAICRHGNLYWHDLRYLCDCVFDAGATPAIWYDAAFVNPEEYRKRFDVNEVLLCPWYYWGLKPENFTKMADFPYRGQFDHLNLNVIEDLPRLKNFREQGIDYCKAGQKYLPTSWPSRPNNTYNLMEFLMDAPDENILGHVVAPWVALTEENRAKFEKAFDDFTAAKAKFYPE